MGRQAWVPGFFLGAILALAVIASPVFAQSEPPSQQNQQGQQPQPNPPQPAPAAAPNAGPQEQSKPADKDKTNPNTKPGAPSGTSNDRLFYALPNFLTLENAKQLPPLTAGQKFKVVARSSFDYVEFPWYGLLAGINQANDSEPGYGQGAQGYAKRYGASFADGTIENFMTGAVMASLLRQDPRFYQTSEGGFMHRVSYAVSRIFVTKGDSGRAEFNASEIVGSALAAGISTYSYHPHADRTLSNTSSVWATQVGYDAITLVIKEFWPDIRRKFSHKPPPDAAKP